ncbi:MAG: hypothetical protein JSV80_03275, partial [Acidobacteriota bacterium]
MPDAIFVPGDVTHDLQKLEQGLRRLRTQYELFLSRTVRWPPNEQKAEVDAIIRHYAKYPPQRTIYRFRFNTLVHRYQTSMERWRRRMRAMETSGPGPTGPGRSNETDPHRPHTLMALKGRRGDFTGEQLRDVYLAYRRARKARGMAVAKMTYG